ncbi:MAG: hypothetical protein ABI036_12915 [Fibrobacteria bacterium]
MPPSREGDWVILAQADTYPSYAVLQTSDSGGAVWKNSGTGLRPPNTMINEEVRIMIRTREGGFAIAGLARDLSLRDQTGGFLLIVDSNGAVTGRTYFLYSPRTGTISALAQTSDGGFVMAAGGGPRGGQVPARLIRCDSVGQILWSRDYPFGYSAISTNSLKIAPDGSLYLALGVSRTAQPYNAAILHADAEGNVHRFEEFQGPGIDDAVDISLTADGGFLLLGNSNGFPGSGGSMQGFSLRADADWNIVAVQAYGPYSGNGFFAGMAALDGKYFALGDVVKGGGLAAWILTLDPMGALQAINPVTLPVTPQPANVASVNTTLTSPVYDVQGKPGFCVLSEGAAAGLGKVYCLTMEEGTP